MDLNEILGLNKKYKKQNEDFPDIVGGGTNFNKKPKEKNDFFGDLDM